MDRLLQCSLWLFGLYLLDYVKAQTGNFCTERPSGCDLFCRYGYRKDFVGCICLCYDPCQGKLCAQEETCLVRRQGARFIADCVSAIELCGDGIELHECLVSPCVLSPACRMNGSLTCIPDFCGGCHPRFFTKAGVDVTRFCMGSREKQPGAVSKPGVCPSLAAGFCLDECENDADCIGSRKCCANDCGKVCAQPVHQTVKVGRCPQPGLIAVQNCRPECRDDQECNGVQKCCSNGCANICAFPQQTTACVHLRAAVERLPSHQLWDGYIPVCDPADGRFNPVQCNRDFCWCVDQQGREQFGTKTSVRSGKTPPCSIGAEKTSKNVVAPRRSGRPLPSCSVQCPHGLATDTSGFPNDLNPCVCKDLCQDVRCPNSFESCQLVEPECLEPACPPVPRCLLNPCPSGNPMTLPGKGVTALCTGAGQCAQNFWCHLIGYSGFGFCCPTPGSAVRPGGCPAVQPGAGGNCAEECRSDASCPQNLKCCYNGCGLSCMAVRGTGPSVKPGYCPSPLVNSGSLLCLTMCSQDSDCDGAEKCCAMGCSVRCEQPSAVPTAGTQVTHVGNSLLPSVKDAKLGECPLMPSTSVDPQSCLTSCQNDGQCPGVRKCCSNGCGRQCLFPGVATSCIHAVATVEMLNIGLAPFFKPKCAADGSFEPVQCDSRRCWCVDGAGREVPGTKSPAGSSPNCRSPKRCPIPSCALLCPFGRLIDESGCEQCRCNNPCDGVHCGRPFEICTMMPVDCYGDDFCPAQPRCKCEIQ